MPSDNPKLEDAWGARSRGGWVEAIVDWVRDNLFELGTAVLGLWLSWRLRSHPALTLTISGFRLRDRRVQQSVVLRLKNSGQSRIDELTYSEPVAVTLPSRVRSVVGTRGSHPSIPLRYELQGVETEAGEAVRAVKMWATLEPEDWVSLELKIDPVRSELPWFTLLVGGLFRSTADLKGNRRGFRQRDRGRLVFMVGVGLLAGVGASIATFLAVHSVLEEPPLGLTFPILWGLALLVSASVPILFARPLLSTEAFDKQLAMTTRVCKERGLKPPTEAEFRHDSLQFFGVAVLGAGMVKALLAMVYVLVVLLGGQSLPWLSLILWSLAVSFALSVGWVGHGHRRKSPSVALFVSDWVALSCTIGIGVVAIGALPTGVGLVLVGVVAVAMPVARILQKDLGHSLSA